MKISEAGLQIIQHFTGFRASSFFDHGSAVHRVGYGSTFANFATGQPVKLGMVVTKETAKQLLIDELQQTEDFIKSVVKAPITQKMFDALCSLTLNIGETNFSNSSVLRLLNLKDYSGAASGILLFDKIAGIQMPLLAARRIVERKLFLQGVADLQNQAPSPIPTTPEEVVDLDPAQVCAALMWYIVLNQNSANTTNDASDL